MVAFPRGWPAGAAAAAAAGAWGDNSRSVSEGVLIESTSLRNVFYGVFRVLRELQGREGCQGVPWDPRGLAALVGAWGGGAGPGGSGAPHLTPLAVTQPDTLPGTERRPAADVLKQHCSGAIHVYALQRPAATAAHCRQHAAAELARAEHEAGCRSLPLRSVAASCGPQSGGLACPTAITATASAATDVQLRGGSGIGTDLRVRRSAAAPHNAP